MRMNYLSYALTPHIILLTFCVLMLLLPQPLISVRAQSTCNNTNCQPPPQHGASWSKWPQNANVTVVIDSRYSPQEQNAIMTAFNNWQASSGSSGNRSGVTFNFTVATITGTPGANQVQVRKEAPPSNSVGRVKHAVVLTQIMPHSTLPLCS